MAVNDSLKRLKEQASFRVRVNLAIKMAVRSLIPAFAVSIALMLLNIFVRVPYLNEMLVLAAVISIAYASAALSVKIPDGALALIVDSLLSADEKIGTYNELLIEGERTRFFGVIERQCAEIISAGEETPSVKIKIPHRGLALIPLAVIAVILFSTSPPRGAGLSDDERAVKKIEELTVAAEALGSKTVSDVISRELSVYRDAGAEVIAEKAGRAADALRDLSAVKKMNADISFLLGNDDGLTTEGFIARIDPSSFRGLSPETVVKLNNALARNMKRLSMFPEEVNKLKLYLSGGDIEGLISALKSLSKALEDADEFALRRLQAKADAVSGVLNDGKGQLDSGISSIARYYGRDTSPGIPPDGFSYASVADTRAASLPELTEEQREEYRKALSETMRTIPAEYDEIVRKYFSR